MNWPGKKGGWGEKDENDERGGKKVYKDIPQYPLSHPLKQQGKVGKSGGGGGRREGR